MPCLFEHGVLVAAMAAGKHRTIGAFGPSAVNIMLDVTPAMRVAAERAGAAFGLHGFVSFDFFEESDGADPIVIELNLRPVPQLHLGSRVGADMALALRDVLSGRFDGTPRLGSAAGTVALFPQELRRLRLERGRGAGTMRWLTTPGALADVPWNDPSLVLRYLTRDR
jgi:hypothetical protein